MQYYRYMHTYMFIYILYAHSVHIYIHMQYHTYIMSLNICKQYTYACVYTKESFRRIKLSKKQLLFEWTKVRCVVKDDASYLNVSMNWRNLMKTWSWIYLLTLLNLFPINCSLINFILCWKRISPLIYIKKLSKLQPIE